MEILRGGATYAVDTLRILKSAHPDTDYVYIIGLDSLKNLSHWKDAETLKRLCTFACAAREGQVPHQPGVQILRTSIPDISSARIRQMVQSGQNADAFMPQNVARYVAERGLYLSDFSESTLRKELRQRLTPTGTLTPWAWRKRRRSWPGKTALRRQGAGGGAFARLRQVPFPGGTAAIRRARRGGCGRDALSAGAPRPRGSVPGPGAIRRAG